MLSSKNKKQLEKQLMEEIKQLAEVDDFPWEDAKAIAKLLAAYDRGDTSYVTLAVMASENTLEKYPKLYENWDDIMIKYHKLGLFPNWNIRINDSGSYTIEESLVENNQSSKQSNELDKNEFIKHESEKQDSDSDDDDDEYTEILSRHMYQRIIAEQKVSRLKNYLILLIIILLATVGFGIYKYTKIIDENKKLIEEYETQESIIDKLKSEKGIILNNAIDSLDYYSDNFAFVTDPQTNFYHMYGCPKLDTDYWYYNTIDNWKSQGKVGCKYCYGKKNYWKEYLKE